MGCVYHVVLKKEVVFASLNFCNDLISASYTYLASKEKPLAEHLLSILALYLLSFVLDRMIWYFLS